MSSLDEVPFKIPMGSLDGTLGDMELVRAPDLIVPDYHQTLRDTEYKFTLENWVLTGLQVGRPKDPRVSTELHSGAAPSCPPFWLMPPPRQSRRAGRECRERPRPRSLSLSAADARRPPPHRSVKFLIHDADGGGYSEDNEGSSEDDDPRLSHSRKSGERPWSAGPRPPHSHAQPSSAHHQPRPSSSSGTRASPQGSRRTSLHRQEPPCHTLRTPGRKVSPLVTGGRRTLMPSQQCSSTSPPVQPRPASAGPTTSSRHRRSNLQTTRPRSFHGRATAQDPSVELLTALGQEERELLEAITAQGYALHTAISALQRTGRRSPEQVLRYLVSCDRLCALGYERSQVEEALEMFQNCESKAAEFLRLLAQFQEMGFQQSAIKEVLLVHENDRERALEELMTRLA